MAPEKHPLKNSFITGLLLGVAGPLLGAFGFYLLEFSHIPLGKFIRVAQEAEILPKMLSLGGVVNLAFFFLLIQVKWYWSARAVVIATFVYVILIMILKFLI